jgi:hypothetical protein
MATSQADLPRIRDRVGCVLDGFLARQRTVLAEIGPDMLPWLDAITGLLAGGKRLRPAFCYWGWRGAGGEDGQEIHAAAAALELLHASALVHDDVMDASDTRRGQPSVHRRFAARHASGGWRGSAGSFGTGTAILVGDLLLTWTDQLFHASGLPPAALARGQQVLDAMRVEVISGQYLDLLGQAAGDGTVASALRVVRYKSAKYTIERPLHLGAALAGPQGCGGQPVTPPSPATASRWASRSSCGMTFWACSGIRRRPGSRPAMTCARGSARSWWRSHGTGPAGPSVRCSTGGSATRCSPRTAPARSARSSPAPGR